MPGKEGRTGRAEKQETGMSGVGGAAGGGDDGWKAVAVLVGLFLVTCTLPLCM